MLGLYAGWKLCEMEIRNKGYNKEMGNNLNK